LSNPKIPNEDPLVRMDREHFIHPYTDFPSFKESGSQIITKSKGLYVHDHMGGKYLDAIAGLWCVNIGHGRQEMADTIAEQVLEMQYYNPFGASSNVPAAKLSHKLAQISPKSLNHVFYSSGGSTANDVAVRLIHYYFNLKKQPNKKQIISRIDGYHGATYVAASLTGIHGTKDGFDTLGGFIHHVSAANMYRRPDGMSESAYCDFLVDEFENRILQLGPQNVAAFIAEPIMGAGGVLVAPKNYHPRMHAICKKYDMLYVSDEVVTAFGRLGEMMASKEVFDVEPDIICLAKGISSGYIPLGATMISDEIYDVISQPQSEGGALTMGFTYSGHAVACAAALKNIEIMETENLCEHVRKVGPYFMEKLGQLVDLPIVGDVRGSHLMAGIELVSNQRTKEAFDFRLNVSDRVFKYAREDGVIVRPVGNSIILSPPLILENTHCDKIADTLRSAISRVSEELQSDKAA